MLFDCANLSVQKNISVVKSYNNRDFGFPPINQKLADIEINDRIDEIVS